MLGHIVIDDVTHARNISARDVGRDHYFICRQTLQRLIRSRIRFECKTATECFSLF
jgi:hypothetical protein